MTVTEKKVREMINGTFVEMGLSAPFKEVGRALSAGVTTYGQAREVFLEESGGTRRDYSSLDAEGRRIQREIVEHQLKLQEAAAADPEYQQELRKAHKRSLKRLAEIFCGEGPEHKEARKAFRKGRAG
jgi:hypothetical protein